MSADAIVCPAHKHLIRGRGLSAQIYGRAGEQLVEECSKLEECDVGESRLTNAYNLPFRFIIHTVTPQWSGGDHWGMATLKQLRWCYESVQELALSRGIGSVMFPALGAGTNRFPHSIAAHQGLDSLTSYADRFHRLTVCLHTESHRHDWLDVADRFYPHLLHSAD